MERSYVYDDEGRVIRRLMRMGNLKQDKSITYNEHGDKAGTVMIQSGSLGPRLPHLDNERSEFRYLYQYDSHGNWTERTTINTIGPAIRTLNDARLHTTEVVELTVPCR